MIFSSEQVLKWACFLISTLLLLTPAEAITEEEGNRLLNHRGYYFRRSWRSTVIPYTISSAFNSTEVRKIRHAMNAIQVVSCVRFRPMAHAIGTQPEGFLQITKNDGDGCRTDTYEYAHSRKFGVREMSLDPSWCLAHGRIMHELMHALGFTHEHQRPDRDEHVRIMWSNIKDGIGRRKEVMQFSKSTYPMDYTFGLPYDLTSLMHYANWSNHAAIDPKKPIILPLKPEPNMGQRKRMDKLDIAKINMAYDCSRRL